MCRVTRNLSSALLPALWRGAIVALAAWGVALTLNGCSSPKPEATATPTVTTGTAPTGANGVANKSAGARVREEDRKVDGP